MMSRRFLPFGLLWTAAVLLQYGMLTVSNRLLSEVHHYHQVSTTTVVVEHDQHSTSTDDDDDDVTASSSLASATAAPADAVSPSLYLALTDYLAPGDYMYSGGKGDEHNVYATTTRRSTKLQEVNNDDDDTDDNNDDDDIDVSRVVPPTGTTANNNNKSKAAHWLSRPPLAPVAIFETYKRQHSAQVLAAELLSSSSSGLQHRQFIYATFACPRQAGVHASDFTTALLLAVATNRTLLFDYSSMGRWLRVGENAEQNCDRLLRRADWIPLYDDYKIVLAQHNNNVSIHVMELTTNYPPAATRRV
jgi:hypothetical protein